MKRIVVFTLFFLATAFSAEAFHLGPATPAAKHGEVNVGLGYFLYEAEWNGIDVEQNRGYLHVGYGMGMEDEPRWEVYIRGGAADLEASAEDLDAAEDFDADYEPFGIVGLKGAFWDGPRFGWGMVLQGGIFGDFENDENEARVEDVWEIEIGFPFQMKAGPFLFYAGPVFYHAEADEVEEDDEFGGFGGLGLAIGDLRLEFEGQIKSDFSAGGFLSYSF